MMYALQMTAAMYETASDTSRYDYSCVLIHNKKLNINLTLKCHSEIRIDNLFMEII